MVQHKTDTNHRILKKVCVFLLAFLSSSAGQEQDRIAGQDLAFVVASAAGAIVVGYWSCYCSLYCFVLALILIMIVITLSYYSQ